MPLAAQAAAIAAATLMAAAGAGPITEGNADMEITRKEEMTTVDGPSDYFTGKATITGMFSREAPSNVTGAIVHFEPGARTAWHTHPRGQTLIVTEGVGWTAVEGGEVHEFHEGDILWCPADTKHWHGATPHEAMTHIAIQETKDGTNVVWMEKVTDEDYLKGPKRD